MNINWYPGHMAKTKRLILEKIDLIDIVYEVIDARIPFSSKIKNIDDTIKNKPRLLIMTKSDLCDINETNKWKKYYEELDYTVILLDLMNNKNISTIFDKTNEMLSEVNKKRELQGLKKRRYRSLIIGIPNVGKSTLINRLVGKKAVNVGNKPGVTKNLEWIRINDQIELLDSPGILWPKFDNNTIALNSAAMTAIKEEILDLDDISYYILETLEKYYPNVLFEQYGIKKIDVDNIEEAYKLVGKRRGCIIKGGNIDYDKVSKLIVDDVKEGKIKGITFDRFNN